jgi:hypothetical protein
VAVSAGWQPAMVLNNMTIAKNNAGISGFFHISAS